MGWLVIDPGPHIGYALVETGPHGPTLVQTGTGLTYAHFHSLMHLAGVEKLIVEQYSTGRVAQAEQIFTVEMIGACRYAALVYGWGEIVLQRPQSRIAFLDAAKLLLKGYHPTPHMIDAVAHACRYADPVPLCKAEHLEIWPTPPPKGAVRRPVSGES